MDNPAEQQNHILERQSTKKFLFYKVINCFLFLYTSVQEQQKNKQAIAFLWNFTHLITFFKNLLNDEPSLLLTCRK